MPPANRNLKSIDMNLEDVQILIKKIFVGIVIYIVPLVIIGGGLLLIKLLLHK